MLRVPELKPDDTPFDPDFYTTMNIPMKGAGNHTLTVAKENADERLHEKGAILMGMGNTGTPTRSQRNAQAEAERQLSLMYNHALVKDAVTNLHREGDEQIAKLAEYNGIRINDIVPDQKRFLSGQQSTYKWHIRFSA